MPKNPRFTHIPATVTLTESDLHEAIRDWALKTTGLEAATKPVVYYSGGCDGDPRVYGATVTVNAPVKPKE